MIYTTLSVHSLRATEITWSTIEITWRSRELRTQKGSGSEESSLEMEGVKGSGRKHGTFTDAAFAVKWFRV